MRGISPINTRRKNFSGFVPNDVEWGETLRMNGQFVLRVETPIKLQIISNDNGRLVLDEDEPEVHFM